MVAVPGPDSSLCFNCVSLRLSGISSDIPLHPLNYLRREKQPPNKLPSPSESRLSLTLAENGTFRWEAGRFWRGGSATNRDELSFWQRRPAGPPAPLRSRAGKLGTVGVTGCDCWPGQERGELRLAAFRSLTGSSVFTSLQT